MTYRVGDRIRATRTYVDGSTELIEGDIQGIISNGMELLTQSFSIDLLLTSWTIEILSRVTPKPGTIIRGVDSDGDKFVGVVIDEEGYASGAFYSDQSEKWYDHFCDVNDLADWGVVGE